MYDNVHHVYCVRLKKTVPGLKRPPIPGEIGKKIYENISQEAWQKWLQRQTMFINEYHLNLTDASARQFLQTQMQAFLFDDIDHQPANFVSPEDASKKLD